MRFFTFLLILLPFTTCFSQETNATKRSIKQDGFTIECSVLEAGKETKTPKYDYSKMYFWFKAQRIMTTQGGSSGLLLNGNYTSHYDENHQLFQSGSFCKGLKNGSWNQWRKNGTLVSKETWKNGELKGKQLYFDDGGKLFKTVEKTSTMIKTSSKDSVVMEKRGIHKIQLLDTLGNVTSSSKFKRDKLHGKQVTIVEGKRKVTYFCHGRQFWPMKKNNKDENTTAAPKEKKRKKKEAASN